MGKYNDKLYGILCDKIGKPEWKADARFVTNALRVRNRDTLDRIIEDVLKTKKTKEWLTIFEGSGMPYAAVNDVKGTLNHEHDTLTVVFKVGRKYTNHACSSRPKHDGTSQPSRMRYLEAHQPPCQVLPYRAQD